MGKGDKKTKRGKISKGTFGVSRPHTPSRGKKVTNPADAVTAKKKKK